MGVHPSRILTFSNNTLFKDFSDLEKNISKIGLNYCIHMIIQKIHKIADRCLSSETIQSECLEKMCNLYLRRVTGCRLSGKFVLKSKKLDSVLKH